MADASTRSAGSLAPDAADSTPSARAGRTSSYLEPLRLHLRIVLAGLLVAGIALLFAGTATQSLAQGVAGFSIVLASCAAGGYLDGWQWTGIGPYRYTRGADEEFERGKTLWDLLQLLIVPGVLGLGAIWYSTQQQTAADRAKAQEQAAQALQAQRAQAQAQRAQARSLRNQTLNNALSAYLDRMSDLLLNHGLADRHPAIGVTTVARARTVGALRTLDGPRNAAVIKFLADAHLFRTVPLSGADLSYVDLSDAPLGGAQLKGANLRFAVLNRTDLTDANLEGADLTDARLTSANLTRARLRDAALDQAHLQRGDLGSADLRYATLTQVDLSYAALDGAQLNGADLDNADLSHATLLSAHFEDASLTDVTWRHTLCPDGTNSATNHTSPQSCARHLSPAH